MQCIQPDHIVIRIDTSLIHYSSGRYVLWHYNNSCMNSTGSIGRNLDDLAITSPLCYFLLDQHSRRLGENKPSPPFTLIVYLTEIQNQLMANCGEKTMWVKITRVYIHLGVILCKYILGQCCIKGHCNSLIQLIKLLGSWTLCHWFRSSITAGAHNTRIHMEITVSHILLSSADSCLSDL